MLKSNSYDFIFFGAGCAGLSLLTRMLRTGRFNDKKFLLIDREEKAKNDRTWCYWEMGNGFFEDVVYKKWDRISFFSDDYSSTFPIEPYRYKMIRGIDFYRYCFNEIHTHSNVEIVYGNINDWSRQEGTITLKIDNGEIKLKDNGATIFNSIYYNSNIQHPPPSIQYPVSSIQNPAPSIQHPASSIQHPASSIQYPARNKIMRLLQHFKGWIIETSSPFFNEQVATIMDFRVHQAHGTSFAYMLPLDKNRALVEYTLVTKELLQPGQYDEELSHYVKHILGLSEYTIIEVEFGAIPMTNEKFRFLGNGWQIGTAGGQTKASSGYTFQFIQKQSEKIVDCLIAGGSLNEIKPAPARFRFYDNTLLHILYFNTYKTDKIFSDLFRKNKPQQVLRFLDNESSIFDELKIIGSLPSWPFLKAAWHQL